MDNVILFNPDRNVEGKESYEALIERLVEEDKMSKGILMSMNEDGKINILLAGQFLTSEVLFMCKILERSVMQEHETDE